MQDARRFCCSLASSCPKVDRLVRPSADPLFSFQVTSPGLSSYPPSLGRFSYKHSTRSADLLPQRSSFSEPSGSAARGLCCLSRSVSLVALETAEERRNGLIGRRVLRRRRSRCPSLPSSEPGSSASCRLSSASLSVACSEGCSLPYPRCCSSPGFSSCCRR